jgi:hypothetical protein
MNKSVSTAGGTAPVRNGAKIKLYEVLYRYFYVVRVPI